MIIVVGKGGWCV